MGYTVSRNDAFTKNSEFEAYSRLLRQRGVDLAKIPRAPEPGTRNRWLYVWNDRADAQSFADELRKRTRDEAWVVAQVDAPPSEGPMGPVIIQVGRRADGLVFAVHPLSLTMIRSAFPNTRILATTVSSKFETLEDFQSSFGTLGDLAREIAPTLTGLNIEQLENLGYAFIEDDTGRTLLFVRPKELVESQG